MKLWNKIKPLYWGLLLPLGVLLGYVGSLWPAIIERYYSTGINRMVIGGLSSASGLLPFSLAEIVVILLVIIILRVLVSGLVFLLKNKRVAGPLLVKNMVNLLACASVLYFIFMLLWGLNYSRLSFAQIANLNVQPAATDEMAQVCDTLIDSTNRLRLELDEDQNGVMRLPGGKAGALKNALAGYEQAGAVYPELGGKYGQPKGLILGEVVSYLGFSGVYFPFTGEANINMAVPDALLPSVVGHEMAHQRGFAREDEANYIAYLTCRLNPDPAFQYSGNLLAVITAMNTLRQYDGERFLQLQARYGEGMRKDLEYYSLFLNKHDTRIKKIGHGANDIYLRSNRQADGMYSYNRMVELLIAEFRGKEHLPDI